MAWAGVARIACRALVSRVTGVVPDRQQVKEGARKVGVAKENPLGLAIGGAAVGFLAGLLLPSTRVEDERIGELADDVKERAKEAGQEAMERGKSVVQEVADTAKETAKERGQEEGQQLASSVAESAKEAAPVGGSSGSSAPGGTMPTGGPTGV